MDYDIVNAKGGKGFDAEWYSHDETDQPLATPQKVLEVDETNIFISTSTPKEISTRWTMKLKGFMRPREEDTEFEFGLTVAGRAKLYIDGNLIIDNWTLQRRGVAFFNTGTEEECGRYLLKRGVAHEIYIEFGNVRGPAEGEVGDQGTLFGGPGVRLGGAPVIDEMDEIEKAVRLAAEAEVAIVVVGLNGDWETGLCIHLFYNVFSYTLAEGHDRTNLKLPGRTDELVARVAEANPNTVVVTQTVRIASIV